MIRSRFFWLVVLAVVCAFSWWLGHRYLSTPRGADAGRRALVVATPWATTAQQKPVHLVVLNGTGIAGLAREVSLELAVAGCVIERVANAPHENYARTLLVNRSLARDRAQTLADLLGGVTLLREWDDRGTEDAVLVLGADHRDVRDALRRAVAGE
jgi:hypothetical protein